jgi:Pin2-interacting protein X1
MKHGLSPDPNNKFWANDKSKFGYKMLQKMGWKEGSGLGAKEDGITDFVKPKRNFETRGDKSFFFFLSFYCLLFVAFSL